MFCYTLTDSKLDQQISSDLFKSPLFQPATRITEASLRILAGGSWDVSELVSAIEREYSDAFLCCAVELIPDNKHTSKSFPKGTCLLAAPIKALQRDPRDHSFVAVSEGSMVLWICKPSATYLLTSSGKVICNNKGKLSIKPCSSLQPLQSDPYRDYSGQDVTILEL